MPAFEAINGFFHMYHKPSINSYHQADKKVRFSSNYSVLYPRGSGFKFRPELRWSWIIVVFLSLSKLMPW